MKILENLCRQLISGSVADSKEESVTNYFKLSTAPQSGVAALTLAFRQCLKRRFVHCHCMPAAHSNGQPTLQILSVTQPAELSVSILTLAIYCMVF